MGEIDITTLEDLESFEHSELIIGEAMDIPLDSAEIEKGTVDGQESIRQSADLKINSATGTVIIQYRGNGLTSGIVPASQTLTTPGTIELRPQGNLARSGHVFVGWRDSAGNIITAGSTIGWSTAVSGTLVLDAHWTPSVVTITYRGNGHTSGTVPANQFLNTPGSITLRPQGDLRRTGRVFIGWRDTYGNIFPAGASVSISVPAAGTITLDAHWMDWIWHQDINPTTGTNINNVGFWSGTGSINVQTQTLGTVSDGFVFHFRMLEAQQAWTNALNVPITGVTQATNAHIRSYGGQRTDIDDFRGEGPSTWAGLAIYPTTAMQQSFILDNTTRNVFRFSGQGQIFVIERSSASTWTQNDIDTTRKTTTHELGHSLGWMGHASRILADNTYVMWWQSSNHFNLKTNEIKHLKQIYDHFR